ncbi:hypothetical protein Pa4123_59610 [Phytohabitans aurantiacus]|uniref:Uncharacterized protein n=2 Tax=Phytohabitans aurantiacus TaxID=3016789 RepID=A0ABQ5R2N3_9ACTN|nr:hypothetical protein Pa4123_59610 [Phytohabitans aurantiacus]
MPDFILMLRQMDEPDQHEWIRWLSDDAKVRIALSILYAATTPAELEMYYDGLRPLVAHDDLYGPMIDRIHAEMWHHFLGGHS